ncbi:MAG TPA: zinc ribbon domain-containing protein [Kofleriaceae bacterium]|nr:zinc ribbon domain-containing protein [Kofleriaceae bacterium]
MSESIIQRHYDGLKLGTLRAHRCRACNHLTFPMTTACESCASFEWDEVTLEGKGQLVFASHGAAPPPHPRFEKLAPYVYGHIKLAEGLFTQAIIRGVEGTPEAVAKLYEKLPVPVVLDVLETADLPVIAFRPEGGPR